MASRARSAKCSVVDCKNPHKCLYSVPAPKDQKKIWLSFIFDSNVPATSPATLFVCANHFTSGCFNNEGQYKLGFASTLTLIKGSVPTVRDPPPQSAASTPQTVRVVHVACQTEPPATVRVGTRPSLKTLQPHFRSTEGSRPIKRPSKRRRLELEEEEEREDEPMEARSSTGGPEPHPEDSVTVKSESPESPPTYSVTVLLESPESPPTSEPPSSIQKIPKYIVYETCLLELFQSCPVCQRESDVATNKCGTFIAVNQLCNHCGFSRKWSSQPLVGNTPAGNLQLSAAVYFTGASFSKLEKIFQAMHLKLFKYDTFRRHARSFLEPAIVHKWKAEQDDVLLQLSQEQSVVVGGDMKAGSPGHCATYGSYALMDLKRNTIIDVQLVQSNEVGGRYHMEKEGLKRSLALVEACGVTLDCIVTDRHSQIQKFLSEAKINQYYDVWDVEKGISKQLEKISKTKECEQLKKWMRSIKNHIYWTAASSRTGPERVAKWTSILNHVQDIHTHGDPLYPKCQHPLRVSRDRSKWLRAGTPAFYKLEKILTDKRILKDVEKLSPHHQTSALDAFHSVILRFAPKNVVFPFLGMLCRLYLAAMHFNENANHPQKKADGEPLFKVNFPKSKKGECTAKPVKVDPTFKYVDELMDLLFDHVFYDKESFQSEVLNIPIPEDPCPNFDRPAKEDVIASYVSRFNQGAG
ncbi:uncharacterized protein LOC133420407 isoform X1 [Cololabis saira]|uniref:uncharacterized protein LOC133420407 isoform X1 n=2 Tax=Cololabis saira TaxID=129043 RepID=UPI002AD3C75F|nr:uncharacterized protein LOC133420407 isoform X1 [Cololabis saira]